MTTRSESSPDAPLPPQQARTPDADKQAILTMFAEMMDEASKTMTHEEFKKAAEKSMQALLRGIGREDEAKKVSERQRPSKPHNEGSNPSSPSNTGAESAPQEAGARDELTETKSLLRQIAQEDQDAINEVRGQLEGAKKALGEIFRVNMDERYGSRMRRSLSVQAVEHFRAAYERGVPLEETKNG